MAEHVSIRYEFACGHMEPAAWYPELEPGAIPAVETPAQIHIVVLPEGTACAWCLGEDEDRLALQARLVNGMDTSSFHTGPRRQRQDSPEERQRWLREGYDYRRRMEQRGRQGQ